MTDKVPAAGGALGGKGAVRGHGAAGGQPAGRERNKPVVTPPQLQSLPAFDEKEERAL